VVRHGEIQQLQGVTPAWVRLTEGRRALRRAEADAAAEVEGAVGEAA
jgi:hypothetical protein